jgi:hypothetical protein
MNVSSLRQRLNTFDPHHSSSTLNKSNKKLLVMDHADNLHENSYVQWWLRFDHLRRAGRTAYPFTFLKCTICYVDEYLIMHHTIPFYVVTMSFKCGGTAGTIRAERTVTGKEAKQRSRIYHNLYIITKAVNFRNIAPTWDPRFAHFGCTHHSLQRRLQLTVTTPTGALHPRRLWADTAWRPHGRAILYESVDTHVGRQQANQN